MQNRGNPRDSDVNGGDGNDDREYDDGMGILRMM